MTIVVRVPAPMLRRGLPVAVGIAVATTPEEEARQEKTELATSECVRPEDRRDTRAEAGETPETRAVSEVTGLVRHGVERVGSSPPPRTAARREALVARLQAAEWQGAVPEAGGNISEAPPEVMTGDRATAAEKKGAALARSGLGRESTLKVADPRVTGSGLGPEMVTGGEAVHRELRVRGVGRDAEVAGPGRMTQRRQRRAELEAEEDLRLELVR